MELTFSYGSLCLSSHMKFDSSFYLKGTDVLLFILWLGLWLIQEKLVS